MSKYKLIAALGSSFAAGPGIEPISDPAAMRSGRNYAHQLADRLGAELVDLTVSGATTANVLDTPQQIVEGVVYPPQLDSVPANADVITITAGGNDLQFAPALLYAAWLREDPDSPIVTMLRPMLDSEISTPTTESVENATAGLVRVVEKAKEVAPLARVILVDYLTVLDRSSAEATPFSPSEINTFLAIQSAIGDVFGAAASRTKVDLVRASTLSTHHALGSDEAWVQPFHAELARTGASFHPNEAGMTAIAAELERVLAP